MCNDRSWKSCSIATIVFSSMVMLGMFIAIGVMNSMFGDNMQCYVDVTNDMRDSSGRRQMFEGMDKIAAQHPSGDGIALGKQALINVAQTFGLGPAVKQLPAFSLAPEGRKLAATPPNDNTCRYAYDGTCDDTSYNAVCACGTDYYDCGNRWSSDYCGGNSGPDTETDAEKVEKVEKVRCPPRTSLHRRRCSPVLPAGLTVPSHPPTIHRCPRAQAVLDVFNPTVIIPAIFTALFLYIGSGLTLKNVTGPPTLTAALYSAHLRCDLPTRGGQLTQHDHLRPSPPPLLQPVQYSCGGKGMFITGSIFAFPSFIIYAIAIYFFLIYANVVIQIFKDTFETAGAGDHAFTKCLDDTQAMFSSTGVGCLIACIGFLGAFISSICASCRRMLEVPSR